MLDRRLAARLQGIVGTEGLATDPDVVAAHTTDWTGAFGGPALAVLSPSDGPSALAAVLACREAELPLLPQGGNTGLVGGGVPGSTGRAPVILSTARMKAIGEIDTSVGHVVAGAGVTIAALQAAATRAGWHYPVDLASRESATVGGTIATNAGGIRACRFGMTRSHVLGTEAVLGSGALLPLSRDLPRDNTGLRVHDLLVGSEGTLGLITKARLRLVRPPTARSTGVLGVADYASALAAIATASGGDPRNLLAAEIMDARAAHLVTESTGMPSPVADGAWTLLLLIETAGDAWRLADPDAVVALDEADRTRLWRFRESVSVAIATGLGTARPVHKLDISVPPPALDSFDRELRHLARTLSGIDALVAFGHVSDGNLHLALAGTAASAPATDEAILGLVAAHGGSISAEHGIGRAKARYLHLCRNGDEIAAMMAIKRALDPDWIFAPGVLLPNKR